MTVTWQDPARDLVDRSPATWDGVWSLLFAAAHATSTLALSVPVLQGLDLTLAAMDLHQAREELDWLHPDLVTDASAVTLGLLPRRDDLSAARRVIAGLVEAAMDRLVALAPADATDPGQDALAAVLGLLRGAHRILTAP